MAAKLIVEEGDLEGFVLSLDNGTDWVIGRDPDESQLVVEDPTVSRRHARCRLESEGFVIENLSETNPIEINGEALETMALLHQGDTVTIGSQIFRFYQETTAHLFDEQKPAPAPSQEKREPKPASEDDDMETFHESLFEEEEGGGTALAEINFDLLEAGRWLLKVVGGPNNGAEFSMQSGREYLIGTDPSSCDIVFHDTSVSRQHARLRVNEDETLSIEDLGSRNGTLIDGKKIQGRQPLQTNMIVSMGTTVFVVYDREGEMQTIISPLLPSIVKVLQTDQEKGKEEPGKKEEKKVEVVQAPPTRKSITGLIILGIVAGLFVIGGIGITNLFRPSVPLDTAEVVDAQDTLQQIFTRYPGLKYSYNRSAGTLLIVGHVVTSAQKQELLYSLQGLPSIRSIDDTGVIIDEFVWQEINQVLARNPEWRGVSVSTPEPGRFVMTGYLKTRKAAENLLNYVGINFPYIAGLERRLVVDEEIQDQLAAELQTEGLSEIQVRTNNGEISFTGTVPTEGVRQFDVIVAEARKIPGIRGVRSFVTEITAPRGIIDITDEYEVTGSSTFGGRTSVVINGRILATGDTLDGRTITRISGNEILLQDPRGRQFRISY